MSIHRSITDCCGPHHPQLGGVIFDMDGVLVDSHPVHRKAWRLFLNTLGREIHDSELDFILDGRKREDILRHLLGDCPAHELEEFGRRKDSIFRQIQLSVIPVPGVIRLVRELYDCGTALAVATSASPSRAHSTLVELGLLGCFDVVVTGDDVRQGKPDPAVYSLARERLALNPNHVLAVEDAVSGVLAATASGLRCLAVALHEKPEILTAAGAAHVVPDFEAVSARDLENILLSDGCSSCSGVVAVSAKR
ncbi:MAG: HAD family phosphatase [Candidatus Sulfotelmatobacter sp.]